MSWSLERPRIHFEITERCNLACAHCMKRADSRDLSLSLVARVLGEAEALGASFATFGGGEPTLHPALPEMLEAACQLGFRVGIVSNARGFARVLPRLEALPRGEVGLATVSFSLDGPDARTHDAVRSPGSFEEVLAALRACRKAGIATTTKTVVQSANLGGLEGIVRLAASEGASAAEFAGMLPTRRGIAFGCQPTPDELRRASDALDSVAGTYATEVLRDVSLGHDVGLVCCDPYRALSWSVDARGRLSLCCMLSALDSSPGVDSDLIADLERVSLAEALPAFHECARRLLLARAERALEGEGAELAEFACSWCAAALGKLEWLREADGSPWRGLLAARGGGEGEVEPTPLR